MTDKSPLINADRLWQRLMSLAEIGALPGGGVNRQALSEGEVEAWHLAIGWAAEAGMETSTDDVGNLFLTLPGRDRKAKPVLIGSHLDTQPQGGKFDGAAGVLSALEAAISLAEEGICPPCDVIAVAWMNEEGSRFAPGMMGSEAFSGERSLDAIRSVHDADGISVREALDALHAAFPEVERKTLGFPVRAYVELHIEQGPILEQLSKVIGIVTGIQGKKTFRVTVDGAEGHAGTLAQHERRDALAAFARMAAAMYREIGTIDEAIKFTIGRVTVEPNAPSVIPARVTFSIDLRHPDNSVLDRAGARIEAIAGEHASPCKATVTPLVDALSNDFDPHLQQLIAAAAANQNIPAMAMLSAAGHDARHLAKICPSAMIFIPCRDGVSHAEHEWVEPEHIAAGASVLAEVMRTLLSSAELQGENNA